MATIKAGTYRFNDVLTAPPNDEVIANINFTVTVTVGSDTFTETFYSISVYFDGDSLEFLYWNKDHLGSTRIYSNGWPEYEGCQFITIPNDSEVSAEFYEWFTANAVGQKQISGVWRFKDVLSAPSADFEQEVNFGSTSYLSDYDVTVVYSCGKIVALADARVQYYVVSSSPDFGQTLPNFFIVNDGSWRTSLYGEGVQTIDFGTEPQYVSVDFYNWLTENATQPSATVTYNGSTIANLFGGQTATLKCEGMRMESDVVVVAGAGASTLGSLTVTENGTYDAAYEAAAVTWDDNTEYDAAATVDGITLRYKKAAGLSVPDDLKYLLSPEYSITLKLPDGTEQTVPLREVGMMEMDDCYLSNELLFTVVWIKDASTVNEAYGTAFEDNTVYVTDFLWMMQDLHGAELTLTAPGKQLDGISSVNVAVEAEPELQYKHVTENGPVYPDEGYDGLSEVYVDVPIPDGYLRPVGTKSITANGTHDVSAYANAQVNVPVPPGYVIPSGTKVITENGTHDVSGYESAEVNVQGSASQNTFEYASVNCPVNIATEVSVSGVSDAEINLNVAIAAAVSVSHEKYYLHFLYNGVRLPRIPDSLLKSYPYAFIRKNTTSGYYELRMASQPFYYLYNSETSAGFSLVDQSLTQPKYRVSIAEASSASNWEFEENATNTWWGIFSDRPCLWSNHDIPNGSATATDIYFEGTDPVPTD